jgi:hypothetical protein
MTTWLLGGATLESGGIVTGTMAVAEEMREELESGQAVLWDVLTAPDTLPVQLDSDWHLNQYVREVAKSWGIVSVQTDYQDQDPPDDVKAAIDRDRATPRKPGVAY